MPDDVLHDVRHDVRYASVHHLPPLDLALEQHLALIGADISDKARLDSYALVHESRVRGGDIQGRHFERAQHQRRVRLDADAHPGPLGHIGDTLVSGHLADFDRRHVDRLHQRESQADAPEEFVQMVRWRVRRLCLRIHELGRLVVDNRARRQDAWRRFVRHSGVLGQRTAVAASDRQLALAVQRGVNGRGEDERLERGAGLALRQCPVELAAAVIPAPDDSLDFARARIQRHQGRLGSRRLLAAVASLPSDALVNQLHALAHSVYRELLQLLVQGREDPVVLRDQLLPREFLLQALMQ